MPSETVDARRVFVVHGRNLQTRDAMFTFLRAIDLDPIEWEEAIRMTEEAAPYTGSVLDIAFSHAKAAVVLLTGDDLACLGQQYVQDHDAPHEKNLTPQARPNVIFEAGMAFGKYPGKTVIVEFGATRPFTDTTGRNTIRFSNDFMGRKKLADRLKSAGCAVNIDFKADWVSAGDFSHAYQNPLHATSTLQTEINQHEEEIRRLKIELARTTGQLHEEQGFGEKYRSQLEELHAEKAASTRRIQELEREMRDYQAQVTEEIERQARTIPAEALKREQEIQALKKALRDATNELKAEKGYHQDYEKRCDALLLEKAALQHQIDSLMETTVSPQAAEIMSRMLPDPSQPDSANLSRFFQRIGEAKNSPNPLLADGSDELTLSSPDDFTVSIKRLASGDSEGLVISISNHRLLAIGEQTVAIGQAQSFDSRHRAYRENRFTPYSRKLTTPVHASCVGDASWLIRKTSSKPDLFVGNDEDHKLQWPDADKSPVQTWRLVIEVKVLTIGTPGDAVRALQPLIIDLVIIWNPENSEFFIELASLLGPI